MSGSLAVTTLIRLIIIPPTTKMLHFMGFDIMVRLLEATDACIRATNQDLGCRASAISWFTVGSPCILYM